MKGEAGLGMMNAGSFDFTKYAFVANVVDKALSEVVKAYQALKIEENYFFRGPEKAKNSSSGLFGIGLVEVESYWNTLKRFASPLLLQLMRNSFSSGGIWLCFET